MKIAFFDTHRFERAFFEAEAGKQSFEIQFIDARLTAQSVSMAKGFPCVCAFVNDRLDSQVLHQLFDGGTRLIALRSAGFNHVDLRVAESLGIKVVRVPEYSPYAVAEHAVALLLTLNRKTHKAYNRVREGNFSIEGLTGFDLHGKSVGVLGTGRIGSAFAKIMLGFGCEVLAYDRVIDDDLLARGVRYQTLDQILTSAKILSLHLPLTKDTKHLINGKALEKVAAGTLLINTSRGALVETKALIRSLKSGHLGGAGLDVYEEEEGVFFENHEEDILQDDQLIRLMTFPNVLLTSHQAFLTSEALANIVSTTLLNIGAFAAGKALVNEVRVT